MILTGCAAESSRSRGRAERAERQGERRPCRCSRARAERPLSFRIRIDSSNSGRGAVPNQSSRGAAIALRPSRQPQNSFLPPRAWRLITHLVEYLDVSPSGLVRAGTRCGRNLWADRLDDGFACARAGRRTFLRGGGHGGGGGRRRWREPRGWSSGRGRASRTESSCGCGWAVRSAERGCGSTG